ncbi:MAG: peptidylprolyl isomerase [Coriobacteriales bacterium]|nr:peptidylprolyl isomerase [Coriobacteriales bacterium]
MAPKAGDTVRVHYTGTLDDGTEFDSSKGREPIEFEIGSGQVIPGFDEAVSTMEVGESSTVMIPAAQAYGEHFDEGVQQVPISAFPEAPEVGWMIELSAPDGSKLPATVTDVSDEAATIDLNHPLAGKDLTFQLELVEIVEK